MGTRANYFRTLAKENKTSKTYIKLMDSTRGKGNWNEDDLAEFLSFKIDGRHLSELETVPDTDDPENRVIIVEKKAEAKPPIEFTITDFDEDKDAKTLTKERMAVYMQHFNPETPNDELMLWELCRNEAELVIAHKQKLDAMNASNDAKVKRLNDITTKLSNECRFLQKILGIDRETRTIGQEAGDHLLEIVAQAKSLIHRVGTPLICMSCARSEANIINQYGFVVWHMEELDWEFKFECPRCHAEITLNNTSVPEIKRFAGWKHA